METKGVIIFILGKLTLANAFCYVLPLLLPCSLAMICFGYCLHDELVSLSSAIGQFKKQFAHLEENSGRSGPVIPLERKHISLPRFGYAFLPFNELLKTYYMS